MIGRRSRRARAARAVEIGELQDTFLISAVSMILIIRLQLWATNYPQLGGGKLHIAHLLWGGLLMLVAIGLLVTFVDRRWRHPAAVIGGAGFGFFIDEVGKFVTSDNDYFFKPSAAIIYICFICLYFLTRWMRSRRGFTPQEYLANALDVLADAAARGLKDHDKQKALRFLRQVPEDPSVPALRDLVERTPVVPTSERPWVSRVAHRARERYEDLSRRRWFRRVVVGIFVLYAAVNVLFLVAVAIALIVAAVLQGNIRLDFTIVQIGDSVSDVVTTALVVIGVFRLRAHRTLDGYRFFYRALLVQIFVGQIFAFIDQSFVAVWGFLVTLALLVSLRLMINQEVRLQTQREPARGLDAGAEVPATAPAVTGAGL
ncbi:MAG TPA: hypothetical protein VKA96_07655 [Solirubrobacteraceae bacterium]|nr:hypothetical protein [Solirubrobacteraceae bacterium]